MARSKFKWGWTGLQIQRMYHDRDIGHKTSMVRDPLIIDPMVRPIRIGIALDTVATQAGGLLTGDISKHQNWLKSGPTKVSLQRQDRPGEQMCDVYIIYANDVGHTYHHFIPSTLHPIPWIFSHLNALGSRIDVIFRKKKKSLNL